MKRYRPSSISSLEFSVVLKCSTQCASTQSRSASVTAERATPVICRLETSREHPHCLKRSSAITVYPTTTAMSRGISTFPRCAWFAACPDTAFMGHLARSCRSTRVSPFLPLFRHRQPESSRSPWCPGRWSVVPWLPVSRACKRPYGRSVRRLRGRRSLNSQFKGRPRGGPALPQRQRGRHCEVRGRGPWPAVLATCYRGAPGAVDPRRRGPPGEGPGRPTIQRMSRRAYADDCSPPSAGQAARAGGASTTAGPAGRGRSSRPKFERTAISVRASAISVRTSARPTLS